MLKLPSKERAVWCETFSHNLKFAARRIDDRTFQLENKCQTCGIFLIKYVLLPGLLYDFKGENIGYSDMTVIISGGEVNLISKYPFKIEHIKIPIEGY